MITKIKGYLTGLCSDITGISTESIVTDLSAAIGNMLPPYVVILSGDGEIAPVFERALDSRFQSAGREIYRKYDVTQPVTIAFGAEDEEKAAAWRDEFLARLAKRLVSGDVFIEVNPITLRQTDNESTIREHFASAVLIEFDYTTYITKEELEAMTVSIS